MSNATASSVTAPLLYLLDTSEAPVTRIPDSGDESECAGQYATFPVEIRDGRTLHAKLDREGFELRRHETAVANFYDDEEVRTAYYPEMEQFVKEVTGASHVLVFDHNSRAEGTLREQYANARGPVRLVHNDFTGTSGPRRARALLPPEDVDALLAGRLAIINVWRPIHGPIESTPLALCDAQSIGPDDLVPAAMVYRHRTGEEFRSKFNAAHRWYYYPQLRREEAVLIKVCDSEGEGRARFSLHTAFDDPTTPANAAPRESIEVRTMAFFADLTR